MFSFTELQDLGQYSLKHIIHIWVSYSKKHTEVS